MRLLESIPSKPKLLVRGLGVLLLLLPLLSALAPAGLAARHARHAQAPVPELRLRLRSCAACSGSCSGSGCSGCAACSGPAPDCSGCARKCGPPALTAEPELAVAGRLLVALHKVVVVSPSEVPEALLVLKRLVLVLRHHGRHVLHHRVGVVDLNVVVHPGSKRK